MSSRNVLQAFASLYRFLDDNSDNSEEHFDDILSKPQNSSAQNLISSFQDLLNSKKNQQNQNISQSFCHQYFTLPQVQIKSSIGQPNSSLSIINNNTENTSQSLSHQYFTLPQVQIKSSIGQPNSFTNPSIQPNSSLSIINNTDNSNANYESQHFIVTDEFLEKCYEAHLLHSYNNYKSLKKEMEKHYKGLNKVSLKSFKNICQTAFTLIKSRGKSNFNFNNIIDLLNLEYDIVKDEDLKYNKQYRIPQNGLICMNGPWSSDETDKLINVINRGLSTGEILSNKHNIDWIKVSKHMVGRSGKQCYDKFRSLPKSDMVLRHKETIKSYNFNTMLLGSFSDFEENEMATEIIKRINNKEVVTLLDVAGMAIKKYYSPISLATRYLIIKSIRQHKWPFDENGEIIISNFEEKVQSLFDIASDTPHILMNEVQMRNFSASLSWCRRFLDRHGLSMRKPHNERRGEVNMRFVKKYLKALAKAVAKYGASRIINMDETFIHTYNFEQKVVGIKNQETREVVRGEKFNAKEGTTVIASIQMQLEQRIPLVIVAKGKTKLSEKKYGVEDTEEEEEEEEWNSEIDEEKEEEDKELIVHSPSGWTNREVMVKYLKWLSKKMNDEPFALVFDVYKSHLDKEVRKEAKRLGIKLIYVPACGTGKYQPLDIRVFGVLKKEIANYEKKNAIPEDIARYKYIYKMLKNIWKRMNIKVLEEGWKIPGFSNDNELSSNVNTESSDELEEITNTDDTDYHPSSDEDNSS